MPKRFTKEELSNIVNDYYNSTPLYKLSEKYGRKPEVILAKLRSIGIYENKTIRWNNEELEILKIIILLLIGTFCQIYYIDTTKKIL